MAQSLPTLTPELSALYQRIIREFLKDKNFVNPHFKHIPGRENLLTSPKEFKNEFKRQVVERFQAKLREWEQSDCAGLHVGPDGLTRFQLFLCEISIAMSQLG